VLHVPPILFVLDLPQIGVKSTIINILRLQLLSSLLVFPLSPNILLSACFKTPLICEIYSFRVFKGGDDDDDDDDDDDGDDVLWVMTMSLSIK
jgi:hypothetical protein